METFTPEQAAFYLATTLPALESEHAMTKKILEALPVHSSSRAIDGLSAADGAKVPLLYGESYDDAEARKAKVAQV